jgi:hypothetical protein
MIMQFFGDWFIDDDVFIYSFIVTIYWFESLNKLFLVYDFRSNKLIFSFRRVYFRASP